MSKIIALGHQKEVGKDTLASYMLDILRPALRGKRIVRRGFADKLYHILHILYGWAGFQTLTYYQQNPEAKSKPLTNGKTPRELLIEVGTPVMRAYDDNIWINACLKDQDYDILIINDLRFPNELDAVRSLGGQVVKVIRPGLEKPTDLADTALDNCQGSWDYVVSNNGDRNKLHNEAESLCKLFKLI